MDRVATRKGRSRTPVAFRYAVTAAGARDRYGAGSET
jgi:hypothetical protein